MLGFDHCHKAARSQTPFAVRDPCNVARLATNGHDVCLFFEVFENFHQLTRPVLWRVLVTQAHIRRLLIGRVGSRSESPLDDILSRLGLPSLEHTKFRWVDSDASEPFDVATAFLGEYLQEFRLGD